MSASIASIVIGSTKGIGAIVTICRNQLPATLLAKDLKIIKKMILEMKRGSQ